MSNYEKAICDVLIIGGGIGGLSCAVAVKEAMPGADVLVVEKNFAGYSGKANRGGGVLQYFDPDKVDPMGFAFFHTKNIGADFTDQELMAKYVSMNNKMVERLDSWGVKMPKKEDGTYNKMQTGPMTEMICIDLDVTLNVRRRAERLGVRFMDKTAMADLITDGKGITGALVFSVLDGKFTAVSARKVVLATGSQDYRVGPMWSSGRGDGIAAAYRAGAELKNTEFGNFAQLVKQNSHNEVVFGENYMFNAKGEYLTPHFQAHRETDISSRAIREWYEQMKAGNGPVHLDFMGEEAGDNSLERQWPRPYGKKFRVLNDENGAAVDKDLTVSPMFIGEQSPISVGHDMQTTIPGLYAIGDCSYCGSGLAGAVPAPPGRNRGSGILNAVFAALMAAEDLEKNGLGEEARGLDEAQIEASIARVNAPMQRKTGVTAKDVIALVQKAMAPVELSVVMRKDRMEKAQGYIEEAKKLVPQMSAADLHQTLECLEAEAMVLSADMHYKASQMRKESRGWFLREDYPEQDNENWLKWITVRNVDGEMTFGTRDLPVEKWPMKPDHLVPITEEEKKSPLYKYFLMDMKQADPRRYAAAAKPVDGSLGLHPTELNRLFEPGYLPLESGFCNLPDGGGMLANCTDMPGVTPEMFDWWFAWHGLEPMRYKIWNHEDHYYVMTRNPEISSNKALSMKERYWNTIHDVQEDVGLGLEHIAINFRNPADIGFDPEKLKDFKGTIVCAGNEYNPVIMCHFLRPTKTGCELRTRFWFGYSIIDGKPRKILPDGVTFPLIPVQALLAHNIKEFTHLAYVLPQLYEEFGKDF